MSLFFVVGDNKQYERMEPYLQLWGVKGFQRVQSFHEIEGGHSSQIFTCICESKEDLKKIDQFLSQQKVVLFLSKEELLSHLSLFPKLEKSLISVLSLEWDIVGLGWVKYLIQKAMGDQGPELEEKIFDLGLEVENIYDLVKSQLERVKKIHDKMIPLREKNIHGLVVRAKGLVGQSPGGDLIDFHESDEALTCFFFRYSSYRQSTPLLDFLSQLKNKKKESSLEDYLQKISETLGEQKKEVQVLLTQINLSHFQYSSLEVGSFPRIHKTMTQEKGTWSSPISSQGALKRDRVFVACSSGIDQLGFTKDIRDFYQKHKETYMTSREFFQEFMITLRSYSSNPFPDCDVSTLWIEVDHHALIEV